MFFISIFIVAVGIGAMAQMWKGRTGAAWWLFAILAQLGAGALMTLATRDSPRLDEPEMRAAIIIMSVLMGGGLSLIIVATLPKRKQP